MGRMESIKVADAVIKKLVLLGVNQAFSVAGGAVMHINDAIGQSQKMNVLYMHAEQACAMAAEGYARLSTKPGLVIATAGPGSINTLNGVFGAYTDSIPMVVISGQSRKNTQKSFYDLPTLRQLGDQEAPLLEMVKPITKAQFEIIDDHSGSEILTMLESAYQVSLEGRPGPVWIEIPVDVQGLVKDFEFEPQPKISKENKNNFVASETDQIREVVERVLSAKRPVFILGTGVRIANCQKEAIDLAERLQVPIITAWTHDLIESEHPLFAGRAGTIGTRPGNIVVQSSDLIITIGSRLNIRQISYNYENFALNAYKIQVDIDEAELKKPFPKIDLPINLDAGLFIRSLASILDGQESEIDRSEWLNKCKEINRKYKLKTEDYPVRENLINPYHIIPEIFHAAPPETVYVCGNATACIVPFQTAIIKEGTRIFSNSGCASMGYDLPAAIGAGAFKEDVNIVCFAGDGSLMMNLQELQTLVHSNFNILLVILDNGGYLSIKQTQKNFFGRFHGINQDSGLSFPNFEKVVASFNLPLTVANPYNWKDQIPEIMNQRGPRVLLVKLDPEQEFEPRLKSRMVNGRIETPQLDDMFPFLSEEELSEIRGGTHGS
jgi:acetolactate synthase-1/2/3 large subunit